MNNKATILIVEDDIGISNSTSALLTSNNYHVIKVFKGKEAVSAVSSYCPDVVLLDLGLPDIDGLEVLVKIREWSRIPVIVVSARGHESEKVEALDLGADDYIMKPFGNSELLARIRTAIRHNIKIESEDAIGINGKFSVGNLTIDFNKRLVMVGDRDVHLTQIEFKIVSLVVQYVGRVLTYETIIKNVWGPHADKDNQILRVNMANIRRKIEENPAEPKYILTEVGVGYRMEDEFE